MAHSPPDRAARDLAEVLPSEVFAGALLGALIGSIAAILGATDTGAVRLAIFGAGVFGVLGFASWVSRIGARPFLGSRDSAAEEQTQAPTVGERALRRAQRVTAAR